MKIDTYTEVLPEDFSKMRKELPEDLELLISTINSLGRSVNLLGRQALSIADNLQADLKTVTVSSVAELPLVLGNRFSPLVPKSVVVANTTQPLSVNWQMNAQNGLEITSLLGSPTYPLTLTLLLLW